MSFLLLFGATLFGSVAVGQTAPMTCSKDLLHLCDVCDATASNSTMSYDCSLPGLESFTPGQYEGTTVNYLSFTTNHSSQHMPLRAREFERCVGGRVIFSEADNIWEDPVADIGTKSSRGAELYDGYFMSK